jgi:hypothetical protein
MEQLTCEACLGGNSLLLYGKRLPIQPAACMPALTAGSNQPTHNELLLELRLDATLICELCPGSTRMQIDARYSPYFVPLTTPCLIGESCMFAEEIPSCSQRLVT